MLSTTLHREDIKAVLRKRHGTIAKFAMARGISAQGVADVLRGRVSASIAEVIELELQEAAHEKAVGESIKMDSSDTGRATHRLNAGGR